LFKSVFTEKAEVSDCVIFKKHVVSGEAMLYK
jgi:hypothetical protein